MIASGAWNGSVILWSVETGEKMHTFDEHTENVTSLEFSADNELLVSGSGDDSLKLWDIDLREEVFEIVHDNEYDVSDVAFSPMVSASFP